MELIYYAIDICALLSLTTIMGFGLIGCCEVYRSLAAQRAENDHEQG